MEAGEVQDRVIAIAEIGGDRARDRQHHARCRPAPGLSALAASIHLARPFAVQRTSCRSALAGAARARRKASRRFAPEHQVEAVVRADFADVDLGRQSGEILRRDLRATRRPRAATSTARRRPGRGCAAGRSARRGLGAAGCGDRLRPRARARNRSARPLRSAPSRMPVAPPFDSGATPAPATGVCSSRRQLRGRGSDAQATPLHSRASAPALFQPGRGAGVARATRLVDGRTCAWLRLTVNTRPVWRIKVKTGLKSARRMEPCVRAQRCHIRMIMARAFRRSGPGHPRAHQHRQDLPRDRADVRPFVGRHRLPAAAAGARGLRPRRRDEGREAGRAADRRGADRPAPGALFPVHRRKHAGPERRQPPRRRPASAISPSPRSTRRSSASTPSAATSSPTGCSAPAAARRR